MGRVGCFAVSIEQVPSGEYRAVVRHGGAKRASEAVPTKAEARMLEAELKLEMGSQPPIRELHSVGEVVSGYLADGAARLSPATLDFYRKGHDAMPDTFKQRAVTTVTPLVLDSLYAELRAGGAGEHKCQKVHRLISASFNRAVRYGWLAANPCLQATKPKVTTREIEPPTPEQVRALIAEAAKVNEDLVVCLRRAAATGARRGEPVALTWSDVVGERLTIRRSMVESDCANGATRSSRSRAPEAPRTCGSSVRSPVGTPRKRAMWTSSSIWSLVAA